MQLCKIEKWRNLQNANIYRISKVQRSRYLIVSETNYFQESVKKHVMQSVYNMSLHKHPWFSL